MGRSMQFPAARASFLHPGGPVKSLCRLAGSSVSRPQRPRRPAGPTGRIVQPAATGWGISMAARCILALRRDPMRIPAILLAAAVVTSAGGAAAQDSGAAPAPQAAPGALQEIVVTANRRSESKENVPIAIEAFSSDQLAATGVTNVADLGTITPGLV